MELGVRLVGVILRILYVLTAPLFWLLARNTKSVSPIRDPILLRSATNLVTAIRNGELTSEKVTYAFIGRIHEVNLQLNAVVDQRFREAMEEARAVDGEVAAARSAGTLDQLFKNKPLLGIPFTVKESCSLAGLSNAVGCVDWEGRRATSDGEAVARMRKAGGIPLLVSNTPELCLGWETTNLVTGTTNNPYCIARTSGGSSGGESALLGCGASVASVSSDIAGSIRIPAAFCGVFGHKPTPGLVPYEGHIPTLSDPLFPQYLSVGPQCRFAEDLSLLLRVMAGPGALDETPVSCDKLRVFYKMEAGHSLALIEVEPALRDVIERAALYLRDECGAALCHDNFKELENTVEMSVSMFFSMQDIPNMLRDPDNPKRDKSLILEIFKSLCGTSSRSLQALGFTLLHRTGLFIQDTSRYCRLAEEFKDRIQRVLGADGVLLYPVFSSRAYRHGQVFTRTSGFCYSMLFNVLGLPATAVPCGLAPDGLPLSIQVIAAPHQDRLCFAVAKQLEKAFGGWNFPQMIT
ncbi:fatty-acid amide hydrolase 2-like [Leptidea sinapis]|uniref:fatty-acid amide hydrolase 2-like n=1 Tax=Leptidea sinapis TaxID=189913 RepID=UPI00211F9F8D|nr:fatty-acid amide hydrolase 2-like [Leptidea sinapis]XP_050679678.1 fatty-acid amide hydrolase 2-like [Leptidea sinapis]